MSKQTINDALSNNVITSADAYGRYHTSGANALTSQGLELLGLPTAGARSLGVERLKEARAAGDRLATCVLGMCAMEGVGVAPDHRAGMRLLEEAADGGSRRAENYLARRLLCV